MSLPLCRSGCQPSQSPPSMFTKSSQNPSGDFTAAFKAAAFSRDDRGQFVTGPVQIVVDHDVIEIDVLFNLVEGVTQPQLPIVRRVHPATLQSFDQRV